MSEPIYRTVFQVEVFTRGRYPALGGHDTPAFDSLEQITYDISEGPCIGDHSLISEEVVPPEDVEAHLIRIGNDGTFFADEETEWCSECGQAVVEDPDGSPGVYVHDRNLGDTAFGLDEDHVALPDAS